MGRRARQFSFRFAVVSALASVGAAINRKRNHNNDRVEFQEDPRPPIPRRDELWRAATSREGGFDLVVIGANPAGLWAAADAASRGLSVCLFEAHDFGSGSATRTPRLLQSGLHEFQRAMRRRDPIIALSAVESQSELQTLKNVAPRLVKPVDVVVPVYRLTEFLELVICGVVSAALAVTTTSWHAPVIWSVNRLKTIFPALVMEDDEYDIQGAVESRHVLVDDSRLAVELACEAARRGAVVVNHAIVTGLDLVEEPRVQGVALSKKDQYWYSAKAGYNSWRDGKSHTDGAQDAVLAMNRAVKGRKASKDDTPDNEKIERIRAVRVLDGITGATHTIPCKAVLNCAGHHTDEIRTMLNPDETAKNFIHFSSALSYLVKDVSPNLNTTPQEATEAAPPTVPKALLVAVNHVDSKSFFVVPHYDLFAGYIVGAVDSMHPPVEKQPTLTELRGVEPPVASQAIEEDFVRGALSSFGISASRSIDGVLSPVTSLFHMPARNPEAISSCIRFGRAVEMKYVENNLLTALGANWETARAQASRLVDIAWTDILHRPTDIVTLDEIPRPPKCTTRHMGIAPGVSDGQQAAPDRLVQRLGLAVADFVRVKIAEDPSLGEALVPGVGLSQGGSTKAEALVAVEREGAVTALDVIRRSPALHINARACYAAVPSVVTFLSNRFKWDRQRAQWEERAAKDFLASHLAPSR